MTRNTHGGGKNTNANGLKFEDNTSLSNSLKNLFNFEIDGTKVLFEDNIIAFNIPKNEFYNFLKELNIDRKKLSSKKYLPNEKIIYIYEKKFQNGGGSVDEKLQTCDFKKKYILNY